MIFLLNFFSSFFVMYHGWRLSHKRFSMSGTDLTNDVALMVKVLKNFFTLKKEKKKGAEKNRPKQ